MLGLFMGHTQPILVVGGRHVGKAPDGVQSKVDGV
jgi:hypothetical protein